MGAARIVLALALWLAGAGAAFAEYPERPIRLLLPFPAGGAVDIVARTMTAKMSEDLGKPFIIENKSGAGGIIATDAVAKSPPDGYTLLLATPNHTINAALQASLPYDTEKDLVPISVIAEVPEVLVSYFDAPFATFPEFVAYARANPGKLNYASAGIGTLPHVTMELLLQRSGVVVTHIPYRGAAPAMTDLLAGVVQLKLDTYTTSNPQVQAGKLRMLGIASSHRSALMPDTPTIAEMGLEGYEGMLWNAIMVPAGTPQPIIDRLNAAMRKVARMDITQERANQLGTVLKDWTAAEMDSFAKSEVAEWGKVIRDNNITMD